MKLLALFTTLFIISSSSINGQIPVYKKMIWNDEFENLDRPDSLKWNYVLGDGCPKLCGWGNNELQYYTNQSENIWVEDGELIIQANKTDSSNYASSKIISAHEGSWLYGRVEVRAKLPEGVGTWPAIWMLPKDWKYGGWPNSGEIDIMEHVGYDQNKVHGTVHTESFNHITGTQKGKFIELENTKDEYHVYAIEWDQKGISFFVDENKYNYFSNTSAGYQEWPFDQPFYLIMNLAVGGNWGGKEGVDDSIWPQRMVIDYVRVYEL